jgi:predicted metalloprotease
LGVEPGVGAGYAPMSAEDSAREEPQVQFVSFVLDDAQDTWAKIFQEKNMTYPRAKLVLFTDATQTGCGYGQAATGPFYCPNDSRVYIDLGFWDELSTKLGAKGEFAQAYVIAHEIGHHVQNVLGKSDEVHQLGNTKGETGASVRLELQADCYAGIWAHSTAQRDLLENGDFESAINAAQSIGDDRLQRMQKGTVKPEQFTHGSSEQRMRWFKKGYDSGRMQDCDTFSGGSL